MEENFRVGLQLDIAVSMRRIPRPSPSRALEPSSTLPLLPLRPRFPSSLCPLLQARPSTAAFSTTSSHAILLPGQKQDKKKHQQFVRRWQKRLLGDSEPIGAHVDPYDPTSPVRIAPEDQGEYEEVLEEDSVRQSAPGLRYLPAEESRFKRPGLGLQRVGGEQWGELRKETARAKDFELFTRRTYTPLTLAMADDIEDLTGTPYTLRDENLMMAQTVHEVTGRPYTRYDFGMHKKVTKHQEIRSRFEQAVVEVYTLKDVGLPLDLSSSPNRGVYDRPKWVSSVRLGRTDSGELALAFPKFKNAQDLVRIMQEAPEWEFTPVADEQVLLEEAGDLLEPVMPQEAVPTIDPATPAFKRAAMVKQDPDKKPFDFMSNRPTPRAAPMAQPEPVEVEEPVQVQAATSTPRVDLEQLTSTVSASQSTINELRNAVLAHPSQQPSSAAPEADTKWRSIAIADPAIKFALFKRLYQLTGIHISDPQLNSTRTLGDLYSHLCTASKPAPAKLFSAIHVEGQKAREQAKQFPSTATEATSTTPRRQRAHLGDLITLGNVNVRRHKATTDEKYRSTGFAKVVDKALRERGLQVGGKKRGSLPGAKRRNALKYALQGEMAPTEVVNKLARRTRKMAEDAA